MDIMLKMKDSKKSNDGVWRPWFGDVEVKIACLGNTKFNRVLQELMSADPRPDLDDKEVVKSLTSEALARACITDWTNIQFGGVDVPFSEEKAVEWMLDARFEDFRDFVATESQKMESFRFEQIQKDVSELKKS